MWIEAIARNLLKFDRGGKQQMKNMIKYLKMTNSESENSH